MSLIADLEVQLGLTGLKTVLDGFSSVSGAAKASAKAVADAAEQQAQATARAASQMASAQRELARGLATGSPLAGIVGNLAGGNPLEGLFGALGSGLSNTTGLLGNLGGALGGGGVLGLPAELLGGLSKGIAGLSGVLSLIPGIGTALGVVGGIASTLVGGAGAVAGALGGLVRGLGTATLDIVGKLFSFGAAVLQNPLVSGVLTGGISLVVGHFGDLAKIAGVVGAGLLGLAGAALKFGEPAKDFQKRISGIAAVSGATPAEQQQLANLSLQLGADPQIAGIGASDAAQAMEELIKAGVSLQDVMGGGARGALLLASAGETSVTEAAGIAANALNVFGLQGGQLVHVADLIAGAANASSISVSDFGFSMQQAGTMAALTGQSVDDLAVAIAIMGNKGIKGQDAGTSIKTFLANLQPQTKAQTEAMRELGLIDANGRNLFVNANGSFKSMTEIAGILHDKTKKLTDAQKEQYLSTIFGSDAIRAAAIFADEGATGFNNLAAAMGKVTAAQVGGVRMDNLAGDLDQLDAAWETLRIRFGTALIPLQRQGAQSLAAFVNAITPAVEAGATWVADRLTRLSGWLRDWGTRLLPLGRTAATSLFAAFQTGDFNRAFGPILDAIAAVFGTDSMGRVASPLSQLLRVLQLLRDTALTFVQALQGNWGGWFDQGINGVVRLAGIFGTYFGDIWRTIGNFATGKIDFSTLLGQLTNNLFGADGLAGHLGGLLQQEGPKLAQAFKDAGKWLVGVGAEWWEKYIKPDLFGSGQADPATGKTDAGLLGNLKNTLFGSGDQPGALGTAFGGIREALLGKDGTGGILGQLWTDLGGWFAQHGPEIAQKLSGFFSFLTQRRPTVAQVAPGEGLLGDKGGHQALNDAQGQKGLLDYFDEMLTALATMFQTRIGPALDALFAGMDKWWHQDGNQAKAAKFGSDIGTAIGDGLGKAIHDAIASVLGPTLTKILLDTKIDDPFAAIGEAAHNAAVANRTPTLQPNRDRSKKPEDTGNATWEWDEASGQWWPIWKSGADKGKRITNVGPGTAFPEVDPKAGQTPPPPPVPQPGTPPQFKGQSYTGAQGGGLVIQQLTLTGPTTDEMARSMAQQLYDALAPLLGEGPGGGGTPATGGAQVF